MDIVSLQYMKRQIDASFTKQDVCLYRNSTRDISMTIQNHGVLPVLHMQILVRCGREKQWIRCHGADRVNTAVFPYCARHCGILHFSMVKVRFYDWFSFLSSSKKWKETKDILVMPEPYILPLSAVFDMRGQQEDMAAHSAQGYEDNDMRDMHAWRDGDRIRHVHWKLYARSDELYVKEMEKLKDEEITLFLDLSQCRDYDAFFTLLYAILHYLILEQHTVRVFYHIEQDAEYIVSDDHSCLRLFETLYRLVEQKGVFGKAIKVCAYGIDGNLNLYQKGQKIYTFNRKSLVKELQQQTALWKNTHA